MKVIYARVSTANQNAERQLLNKGHKVYLDVCSGVIPFADRPEAKKLLKAKDVTEIEVDSIDRLGRNLLDILRTIELFTKQGIKLKSIKEGFETLLPDGTENPIAKIVISVMASISEMERNRIKQRTTEGIAIAKAKGKYKGRKRGAVEKPDKTRTKHAEKIQVIQSKLNEGYSVSSICEQYSYSRSLVYRLMNKGFIEGFC